MLTKYGPFQTGRDDLGATMAYHLFKDGDLHHFPNPWIGVGRANIPPFSGHVATSSRDYFRFVDAKRRRRLTQLTTQKFEECVERYINMLSACDSAFGPLLSSYDDEVVLPTTCALGYLPPAHFDMDEKGVFGTGRKYKRDPQLMEIVFSDLRKLVEDPGISLTLKRGTNLGYPTQKSGRSRDESDVLLAIHVALVAGARSRGMRLAELDRVVESRYGPGFCIGGERYQHTDRVVPCFMIGGVPATHNIGQRVRGIYYSSKYKVAWNRRYVKTVLKGIMRHPMHTQDREEIKKWFEEGKDSDEFLTFSLDVSRFDQSHGFSAAEDLLWLMARLCETQGLGQAEDVFDDLKNEFCTDDLVSTSRALFLEEGGQILSSGLASTSVVGCLASHTLAYELAHELLNRPYDQVHTSFGRDWSAKTWGDDIVFRVRRRVLCARYANMAVATLSADLQLFSEKVKLKFDAEPTLKFLGQNYDMLTYSDDSDTGYPLGRFIQQQFFPERSKTYPFKEIGYIARKRLLSPAIRGDVHAIVGRLEQFAIPIWREEDEPRLLEQLVKEVERYSQNISQLDDVLGVFTHGLDPEDASFSGIEEFEGLVAAASIDVSDPVAVLANLTRPISRDVVLGVKEIMKGELTRLGFVLQNVGRIYGTRTPMLGQMYY